MSTRPTVRSDPAGPFRAEHITEGSHYELSNGHPIHCMAADTRHGIAHVAGALILAATADQPTGIDVGVEWNDGKNLRAPDVSVGIDLQKPGYTDKAPPLAVEYAAGGQDEAELAAKISELLELGTRAIWVVRLTGPLRVEVHEPGAPVRIVDADGVLTAPDVLDHPVPVRALIDPTAAKEAALHNLLAARGYGSIEAIRAEQTREILRVQLAARGWELPPPLAARIAACADLATLMRWITQVIRATDLEAALR